MPNLPPPRPSPEQILFMRRVAGFDHAMRAYHAVRVAVVTRPVPPAPAAPVIDLAPDAEGVWHDAVAGCDR